MKSDYDNNYKGYYYNYCYLIIYKAFTIIKNNSKSIMVGIESKGKYKLAL